MKTIPQDLLDQAIDRLKTEFQPDEIFLYGSHAWGTPHDNSDVDLLVDVTGATTPWFPGSLTADLEQLLGKRVQVVIHRSLSPLIREAVLREAVPL